MVEKGAPADTSPIGEASSTQARSDRASEQNLPAWLDIPSSIRERCSSSRRSSASATSASVVTLLSTAGAALSTAATCCSRARHCRRTSDASAPARESESTSSKYCSTIVTTASEVIVGLAREPRSQGRAGSAQDWGLESRRPRCIGRSVRHFPHSCGWPEVGGSVSVRHFPHSCGWPEVGRSVRHFPLPSQ